MNELKKSINEIHKLSFSEMDDFISYWKPISFSKKELITQAGSIENYFYFIIEGVQKAYYVKNGKEFVIAFMYPFSFTCIPESFLTQQVSNYSLECITDSKLLRISYSSIQKLMQESHEIETLIRKSLENALTGLVNRYHELLSFSMEEKFRVFMKRSPQLLHLVPQKDIASYLGIDPTNFSKLINSIKI